MTGSIRPSAVNAPSAGRALRPNGDQRRFAARAAAPKSAALAGYSDFAQLGQLLLSLVDPGQPDVLQAAAVRAPGGHAG